MSTYRPILQNELDLQQNTKWSGAGPIIIGYLSFTYWCTSLPVEVLKNMLWNMFKLSCVNAPLFRKVWYEAFS